MEGFVYYCKEFGFYFGVALFWVLWEVTDDRDLLENILYMGDGIRVDVWKLFYKFYNVLSER